MPSSKNIAILIPAAGSSSRMGITKQLLPWGKTSLLGNCISRAQVITDNIAVVTGAYKNEIEKELEKVKIDTVYNPNWEEGLGNSIAFGVHHLVEKYQDIKGILILLPDQPYVTTQHLMAMVDQFSNNENSIVATRYSERNQGVPVLFTQKCFEELKELTMDNGAKAILKKNVDRVISITPDFKLKDIDTNEDYRSLQEGN